MIAMRCACPKCQMALQIAQTLPARVKCPRCQMVFTVAGPGPTPPSIPVGLPADGSGIRRRPENPTSGVRAIPIPTSRRVNGPIDPADMVSPDDARRGSRGVIVALITGTAALMLVGVVVAIIVLRKDTTEPGTNGGGGPPESDRTRLAVEKGVSYLRAQLTDEKQVYLYDTQPSSHVGVVALAGLTLLECGAFPDEAAIEKAVASVRRESGRLTHTYALALSILFLDRLLQAQDKNADPKDRELIQRFAVQIVAGQNPNGGWHYHCPVLDPDDAKRYLADLKNGRPIPLRQHGRDDNSINQFATLGLWAARRHEVKTDDVLVRVADRYRQNQNRDGSWGYVARNDDGLLKDATTCAGLIGLAVGQVIKSEQAAKSNKQSFDAAKDPAIAMAFNYLSNALGRQGKVSAADKDSRHKHTAELMSLYKRWNETNNPTEKDRIGTQLRRLDQPKMLRGTIIDADAWGDLYFLWSVERVGMIYDKTSFGTRDWYAWGSQIILDNQQDDGSWRDRFPGVPDTCFALLFLRRANVAKDLTDKLKDLGRERGIGQGSEQPAPDTPARKE